MREIGEAELIVAQQAIEKEAKRQGVEPYTLVALFNRDGQLEKLEPINAALNADSMKFRTAIAVSTFAARKRRNQTALG